MMRRHSKVPMRVDRSPGYKRLHALWNSYINTKVTEALRETAASSVHAQKSELRDLNAEQALLLALIHSLIKKDTAACFVLTEIAVKLEPLKSPYLNVWLKEEYFFNCDDIRRALAFAADLAKVGLVFPELILVILENLYHVFCAPKKSQSQISLDKATHDRHLTLPLTFVRNRSMSAENISKFQDIQNPDKDQPVPKPRKFFAHLIHTSVMPRRVAGEYNLCEQLSLSKELQIPPKIIESPLSPSFKEFKTSPAYDGPTKQSKAFVDSEIASHNLTAISEVLTETDAVNEKTGDTALHVAVSRENLSAVLTHIKRGVSVNSKNKAQITPLQIAVERESIQIIKALVEAGADINAKNGKGETVLHIAASCVGIETIQLLIELGADLNALDSREQSPPFRATSKGYVIVLEKLIEHGANINITDNFGRTLLHYAAWHGQVEIVAYLLKKGLLINAKTKHGWTPIHWAVANGQVQVVHLLLKEGANVNARDIADHTPLFKAIESGHLVLIDMLKKNGGLL